MKIAAFLILCLRFMNSRCFRLLGSAAILVLLTGCENLMELSTLDDPINHNRVASSPGHFWMPKITYDPGLCPDLDFDEDCSEIAQNPYTELTDLIDVALRNNPTTKKTWFLARAAVYNVGVARSALYPTITGQESLNYIDFDFEDRPIDVVAPANETTTSDSTALFAKKAGTGSSQVTKIQDTLSNKNWVKQAVIGVPGTGNVCGVTNPQIVQAGNPLLGGGSGPATATGGTLATGTGGVLNPAVQVNPLITGEFNPIGTSPYQSVSGNSNLVNGNTGTTGSNGINEPLTSVTSNLSVSYLLLDFGGRSANIEAAKQALYETNWLHNQQVQNVIFTVLQDYYTYTGIFALLEARQADLKNADYNLKAATQLFEAGLKTKLDVLQARTNLINIQLNIVDLEGQLAIAKGNLTTALGLPADSEIHIPKFPENVSLDKICASIEELIEIAKTQRPDYMAFYAEYERLKANVVVARSQGLPTLTANASFQQNSYLHHGNFNNHFMAGSIALNVPIFTGFLYRNEVKRAQEVLKGSYQDIRDKELNVILDVMSSYFNFRTAIESFRYSAEYVKYSEEAYEAALFSYREGISTILDLLNAQLSLANARAQKIQARTNWAISLANVAFSTGVLGTYFEDAIKCRKQQNQS